MSVTRAPRARIAVNASWPGVSRKTTRRPSLLDLARADVLGDAAALAGRDLAGADRVEQAGLAVVDVAHHGHDRRPRLEERLVVLLEQDLLGGLGRRRLAVLGLGARQLGRARLGDLVAELARHERGRVAVERLVDAGEDAALDQLADDVRGVDAEQLGELLDGDRVRDLDRAARCGIERLDRGRGLVRIRAALRLARAAVLRVPLRLRAMGQTSFEPRAELGRQSGTRQRTFD